MAKKKSIVILPSKSKSKSTLKSKLTKKLPKKTAKKSNMNLYSSLSYKHHTILNIVQPSKDHILSI